MEREIGRFKFLTTISKDVERKREKEGKNGSYPPSESSMEKGAATVEKGGEATSQLRIFRAYVALIGGVARMGEGEVVRVNYEQPIILRLKLITRSAEDKSMA